MILMRLCRVPLCRTPRFLFCLIFFTCFTSTSSLRAAPRAGIVFESEADPEFVLRLSFRVAKPQGTTSIYFEGEAKQRGYRLALAANEIVLVETGTPEKRLAATPAHFAAQNSLLITRREKLLRVTLNNRIVLETTQALPTANNVVIHDPGARLQMLQPPRYQPTEEIYLTDDFMVSADSASGQNAHWEPVYGTWHVAGVAQPQGAADPFKFVGFATDSAANGISINRDSRWFWNDYQTLVSSRLLDDKASMGIIFAYQGASEYSGLTWSGTGTADGGRLKLWQRRGDQTITLAERPARALAGQWYRLAVAMHGKHIVAYVDENSVLKADNMSITGGQFGLVAGGEAGAEFDDVRVQSVVSTALAASTRPDSGESWQTRRFATDTFMAAWGDAGSDWEPVVSDNATIDGQNWFQHRSHFFDPLDVTIALPALTAGSTPGAPATELEELIVFGTAGSDTGYRFAIAGGKIALYINGKNVANAPVASFPQDKGWATTLRFFIASGIIRVLRDDHEVIRFTDPAPLRSGRVALLLSGKSTAGATNRRSETAKNMAGKIARAVQLESTATHEYRFDAAPVDWKIESGTWQSTTRWACVPEWNFFGGWGEPVATIWNKRRFGGDAWIDVFLAPREGSSDRMHFTFPVNLNVTFGAQGEQRDSGYTLVFRSHDQTTMLFREGKKVAETKDLVLTDWRNNEMFVYFRLSQTWQHLQILKTGGHIQVWVEIPAQHEEPLKRRLLLQYTDPQPLQGDRMALWTWGRNGMSVARVHVASARPGTPVADFLEAKTTSSSPKRHVNAINGGSFRTNIIEKPVEAKALPVVAFDYRHTPNAALALYAVAGGQRFRADFLGSVTQDGDSVAMGAVTRTELDPKQGWKRAGFPLQQALREFFPTGNLPRIDELFVANLSTRPEHIGGLEANAKGAVFEWRTVAAVPPPVTMPQPPFALSDEVQSTGLPDVLRLKATGDWVDPSEYSVAVNNRVLPWGQRGLSWHSKAREIQIDLLEADLSFNDNQKVRLTIAPHNAAPVLTHEWTHHIGNDKTPPAAPLVSTLQGPDRVDTFETNTGAWKRIGGEQGATLWRDSTTAAGGRYSLRLFHRDLSGTFGAQITDKPFDARRWPMLTFDYRMKPEVQLSLVCEIAGKWYEFRFSDVNRTFQTVGSIQNVKKDGQWQQATVDLLGAVRRSGASTTVISQLFFADTGYMNNLQDTFWHIDNVRFVPALPVGQADALKWKANDLSGIGGYSWVVDNAAATIPDEVAEPDAPGAAVAAGTSWLHVRARDRAGNWGPATHFRFAILPTTDLPAADVRATIKEAPPADKQLAAPVVEVQLNAANLLDAETVRWQVTAGDIKREYDLAGNNLRLDTSTGVLRWQDAKLSPRDGKPFSVTMSLTASDLAGKEALRRQWQWTINPALDKTPPPAPFVSYIPTNRLTRFHFEDGMPDDVQLRRSAWVLHDEKNGSIGKASARVVNLNGGEFFGVFLKKTPYAASRYPHVSFDYRFEPGAYNLNLVAAVNGDLQTVKMTDSPDVYQAFIDSKIGKIDDFRTDGQWHNATFDFGAMLRKRYPTAPRFLVEYVGTWATGAGGYDNPQGASMWLDNIAFFSTDATSAAFEWQPPLEDNGIRGYSYVLDGHPSTLPSENIVTDSTKYEASNLKPGQWYFHVRACDGAGNWGPAAHVPFELTAPKP